MKTIGRLDRNLYANAYPELFTRYKALPCHATQRTAASRGLQEAVALPANVPKQQPREREVSIVD